MYTVIVKVTHQQQPFVKNVIISLDREPENANDDHKCGYNPIWQTQLLEPAEHSVGF